MDSNHWFVGSPPNFRTLYLGRIEVDSADFWTNRLLSWSSRSAAEPRLETVAYAHIEVGLKVRNPHSRAPLDAVVARLAALRRRARRPRGLRRARGREVRGRREVAPVVQVGVGLRDLRVDGDGRVDLRLPVADVVDGAVAAVGRVVAELREPLAALAVDAVELAGPRRLRRERAVVADLVRPPRGRLAAKG